MTTKSSSKNFMFSKKMNADLLRQASNLGEASATLARFLIAFGLKKKKPKKLKEDSTALTEPVSIRIPIPIWDIIAAKCEGRGEKAAYVRHLILKGLYDFF